MKKIEMCDLPFYAAVVVIVLTGLSIVLCGCSHNGMIAARGKVLTVNSAGLTYVNGILAYDLSRENTDTEFEFQDADGVGSVSGTHQLKGGMKARRRIGKQVSGYLVDLSKRSPQAVLEYLSKAELKDAGQMNPLPVYDAVGTAIAVAREAVKDKEAADGPEAVFSCDGDCEYLDLTGNADIAYQLSIALKLLEYDGDSHSMADTGERYRATLEHFIGEVVFYKARGHRETPLRVKRVKVENKAIVDLMYSYVTRDGEKRDVTCPSCCFLDDKDAD